MNFVHGLKKMDVESERVQDLPHFYLALLGGLSQGSFILELLLFRTT